MNKTTLNSQKEKHSMLSLRRATAIAFSSGVSSLYFYPRSPCGERLLLDRVLHGFDLISIHALLAESDEAVHLKPAGLNRFLSTLSLR